MFVNAHLVGQKLNVVGIVESDALLQHRFEGFIFMIQGLPEKAN